MIREQYEKLVKYEQIFKTAINSQYYRSMDSRFAADFVSVCHELNVFIKTNCGACVLRALQTVGNQYFNFQKTLQAPEKPEKTDDWVLPDSGSSVASGSQKRKVSKNKKK